MTRVVKKRGKRGDGLLGGSGALERKPYYDEKDRSALRLMRKLRVDWSAQEDSFLLLCKVAGAYLCQNTRSQMVCGGIKSRTEPKKN